ncbi:MAG: hypothetical protein NVSMB6_30350 [Burkholderiaceae bacterium]
MVGKAIKSLAVRLLTPVLFVSFAAFTNAAAITGGTTSVTLDAATVTALTNLGFSIMPVAPSTLSGTPLVATFPITGGDSTMVIDHSGGLAFTLGSTTADIQNFTINLSGPSANTITGQLVAGSNTINGVTLFDIGTSLSLTLDKQLAADLTSAFNVPNLAGAAIGTASVSPLTATPEPASLALAGFGLSLVGVFVRRRARPARISSQN